MSLQLTHFVLRWCRCDLWAHQEQVEIFHARSDKLARRVRYPQKRLIEEHFDPVRGRIPAIHRTLIPPTLWSHRRCWCASPLSLSPPLLYRGVTCT